MSHSPTGRAGHGGSSNVFEDKGSLVLEHLLGAVLKQNELTEKMIRKMDELLHAQHELCQRAKCAEMRQCHTSGEGTNCAGR